MPIWVSPDLNIDLDAVLRNQGAEPKIIRKRSPHLVDLAGRALEEAKPLLEPRTLYLELEVQKLRHERLLLSGDGMLSGKLVAEHLSPAARVNVILCTVGGALEARATHVSKDDIVYGLALDSVGSAAVEALANAACKHFEELAVEHGYQSSIPLSPGMLGWPVEKGQPEIFEILKPSQIDVSLSQYGVMVPKKSLSMVLGFGKKMNTAGRTCDYCAMRETCRYQDHFDQAHA